MNKRALAANGLWYASNLPAWHAFVRAIQDPERAQDEVFCRLMRQASRTAFGRAHGLTAGCSYEAFGERVPLRPYDVLAPWIQRLRDGEQNVLTADPVCRLSTTSGTTSGRKLIPYTATLRAEFNRAIAPWIVDLFHTHPALFAGRAYWSISPVARPASVEPSAVPIGFEDDSDYLGGIRKRLVDSVMAVPSSVRHASSMEEWRQQTIQFLRPAKDLRLISIWHPSFLNLLFQHDSTPLPPWPKLSLISCWADGYSALPAADLARQFPKVALQPKGLLATEGVVSIPFRGRWPLAVRSHFLEFLDSQGGVRRSHELDDGQEYEVILTTGGGLYRYRLGDLVRVEGFAGRTPSVRFRGKANQVSDRFGEKLAEPFVAGVLDQLRRSNSGQWTFAMLAPDGNAYCLFIEGEYPKDLANAMEIALQANPHYRYCRDLGQLRACTIERVSGAHVKFIRRMVELGQRPGDVKPAALSPLDDWRQWLSDSRNDGPVAHGN
jgi:hypothetical protein